MRQNTARLVDVEDDASRAAAFTPDQLRDQLRSQAGRDRRLIGSGRLDPLLDILIHGQDIARPLGLDHPMPPERVAPALEYLWTNRFHTPQERFTGIRFAAADIDWPGGAGPAVHGTSGDLLLPLSGRPVDADRLIGPGVSEPVLRDLLK